MKCWTCGAEAVGGDVCRECRSLQPLPAEADHWTVLGLPRRLALDRTDLETRFHELNRRFHPDYFRLRSPEEQAISLENSAAVNTAYRTLRDPIARAEYLLAREGLTAGSLGQAKPPADLFEEIMELQEARQELSGASPEAEPALRDRLEAARVGLEARRARTEADLAALFPRWDEADEAGRRHAMETMRGILATRAYLRTVLRDLNGTLGSEEGAG